jgi:TetR/AcrR family transcriptional regulator
MIDNRTIILNCALELFASRGYDAVGVQEVAEAAGITKPTLYHYYGSKLGLLKALFETYHAPLNQAVQQAAEYHGDLPLTLERLARAYFEFARQHPVYYRMMLALYFAPRHSDAHTISAEWNERQHTLVESMFAAAVRDHGNMRNRQRLYAATLVGALNTGIALWLNGYAELDDELIRRILHQFEHGIYS